MLGGRVNVAAGLNVRAEPNAAATVVSTLRLNQPVTLIARSQDALWLQLILDADAGATRTGWVAAPFIDLDGTILDLPIR